MVIGNLYLTEKQEYIIRAQALYNGAILMQGRMELQDELGIIFFEDFIFCLN
jgi:hypothetical protein